MNRWQQPSVLRTVLVAATLLGGPAIADGPQPRRILIIAGTPDGHPPGTHEYARLEPATPDHPICRGIEPFTIKEEIYWRIRFRDDDTRLVPILKTVAPGDKEPQTVAWAVERADGGRGFGFTGGHFFGHWENEPFRRLMVNAILWTAKAEVRDAGQHEAFESTGR
jgi:type 1 glutamine amidotransferase